MAQTIPGPLAYMAGRHDSGSWMDNMPVGVELLTNYSVFFDDFNGVAINLTNDWTDLKTTGAAAPATVGDTAWGEAVLTSQATTDNSGCSIQGNEIFQLTAGKKMWFEARVKVSDADDSDGFIGLCENFITAPENCLTSSNRIGFQHNEGNASIMCKAEASDVESSLDSGIDLVDATYVVVGWFFDGSTLKFYVNKALVATMTSGWPTGVLMTPAFFGAAGNASGTHTRTIDYILVVAER